MVPEGTPTRLKLAVTGFGARLEMLNVLAPEVTRAYPTSGTLAVPATVLSTIVKARLLGTAAVDEEGLKTT